MSPVITTDTARRSPARLRLLRDERAPRLPEWTGPPEDAKDCASVLIAGADALARAKMLRQLRGLLPDGTPFVEARETWEVVAKASASRMVVLTGDLGDLSARGLMRVLSRRHPLLPVIALAGCAEDAPASELGAASL
jgi:hypothetical protein